MGSRQEVTLTVLFGSRRVSTLVVDQLSQKRAVEVEIVRGRLSARTAWLELRLRGEARALEGAIQYCNAWSVQIPYPPPKGR